MEIQIKDSEYKKLLRNIINTGIKKMDRTGVGTISMFGYQCRFNLQEGFPIVTEKKTAFKAAITELIWMIGGWKKEVRYQGLKPTNIRFLLDNNCKIWTEWPYKAYKQKIEYAISNDVHTPVSPKECNVILNKKVPFTQEEFEKMIIDYDFFAEKYGDLGPVYQKQWRNFEGKKNHVDQLKNMIERLQSNPDCRRNLSSYWNPTELSEMLLPPCFVAGTSVKTENGYSPIEDLQEGNLVLSDKGNVKKINTKWITEYKGEMYKIRPWYSLPIECTPNHPFRVEIPFEARNITEDDNYKVAEDLRLNDWLAIKKNTDSIIPEFSFKQGKNQYQQEIIDIDMKQMDYWYLMGYFLGDGWIIDKSGKIQLSVAIKDLNKVLGRISTTAAWCIINNSGVNVKKVETRNKTLNFILSKLGKYAHEKFIPSFIESAPIEYIKVFLEGYADADGHYGEDGRITYSTVSKSITLGLQSLYAKLGQACSIIEGNKKEKEVYILGRKVKTKRCYNVTPSNDNRFAKNSEHYLYIKIKSIERFATDSCLVYNFDIEDDHTYIANNICNHNCHLLHQVWTKELTEEERYTLVRSNALCGKYHGDEGISQQEYYDNNNIPKRAISLQMYQRSSDTFLGVPFDWVWYAAFTHILADLSNMVVGDFIWVSGDTHLYLNSLEATEQVLNSETFDFPKFNIKRKVEKIEDYKIDDFELIDYKSGPAIKVAVAV